jgi:hypothetical protein
MSHDAHWYTEVECYTVGASFRVVARAHVIGWTAVDGERLPVIATGVVDRRAFIPNHTGMGLIETRARDGSRRWWSPVLGGEPFDDVELKRLMAELREAAAKWDARRVR